MTRRVRAGWYLTAFLLTMSAAMTVLAGVTALGHDRAAEALIWWFVGGCFSVCALACGQIGAGK